MTDRLYQGEPPDTEYSKQKLDRARAMVGFCIYESSKHYDPWRRSCDDWYDRYTNQPLKLRQTNRIRSNVPSGIVPEMIDSIRADMMDKIFKKRPWIPAIAREPDDFDTGRLIEALHQFDKDQMRYWEKADVNLLSACLWGTGLAKMAFETRMVKVPVRGVKGKDGRLEMVDVVGYQGPTLENVFIYDGFPHPLKQDCSDAYPITHITYESLDVLEELAEAGVYDKEEVRKIPDKKGYTEYDSMAKLAPFDRDDIYERADQRSRMGWTTDSRLDPDGIMVCETECMFRHRENDPPVRTIITVANGCVIRCEPSPLRNGESVWLNGKIMNIPGQFYGMSLVQKNKPQVHVAEVSLNMGLGQLAVSVNRQKIIRPDLVMNASSFDDTPNGIIFAKPNARDLDQVVKTIDPISVAQDVFAFMNWGQGRSEAISANTDLKSGRTPTGERTATASNLAYNQASVRFKHMANWYSRTFLIPCEEKMLAYNRDYLSQEYVFQVTGKSGTYWGKVQRDDLAINVDFVFLGADRDENEALQIAQLENFLKIVSPMQVFPWVQTVLQDLVVQLADKMDYPDMEMLKERMGYGKPIQQPIEPDTQGAAGGPSKRQDRRVPSAMQTMQNLGRSISAMNARGGGGVRV